MVNVLTVIYVVVCANLYFQVKNHLWIFVNALIVNPTFDSQTKENMTLQAKSFGSKCQIGDKFAAQVCSTYNDLYIHALFCDCV